MKPIVIIIAFLISANILSSQSIQCSIIFKDTLMLGQPMPFDYKVYNTQKSAKSVLYNSLGNNHNNLGRDESFTIEVSDHNQNIVKIKESIQDQIIIQSRYIRYKDLEQNDSLTYKLWIEDWAEINKPGLYSIGCGKEITISVKNDGLRTFPLNCTSYFEVTPFDSTKLKSNLQKIWSIIENENSYFKRNNQIKLLCRYNSKLIIPYLDQIISLSADKSEIYLAIRSLSKFKSDKNAFSIASKPFFFDKDRINSSTIKTDLLYDSVGNLKRSIIRYLAEFDNNLYIPFMYKHRGDSHASIRLYIMRELHRLSDISAYEVIMHNLDDDSDMVRLEAKRLQKFY